ncbi:hypothetical protein B0H17DRAFT_1140655 [Mycena rosella]|uniref:Uncharacterized protein n=1 Tax=Mycena rosella TaxID=1033263 RepID=A0AAD7D1I1_MYCRO|nr:hypothetical protein B0H17DRAFT_1140655 [Mycena rosella]
MDPITSIAFFGGDLALSKLFDYESRGGSVCNEGIMSSSPSLYVPYAPGGDRLKSVDRIRHGLLRIVRKLGILVAPLRQNPGVRAAHIHAAQLLPVLMPPKPCMFYGSAAPPVQTARGTRLPSSPDVASPFHVQLTRYNILWSDHGYSAPAALSRPYPARSTGDEVLLRVSSHGASTQHHRTQASVGAADGAKKAVYTSQLRGLLSPYNPHIPPISAPGPRPPAAAYTRSRETLSQLFTHVGHIPCSCNRLVASQMPGPHLLWDYTVRKIFSSTAWHGECITKVTVILCLRTCGTTLTAASCCARTAVLHPDAAAGPFGEDREAQASAGRQLLNVKRENTPKGKKN